MSPAGASPRPPSGPESDRGATRGQTLHDFALGMVIFLLVLGYVFAFVPTLFEPFAPQTDSSPVRADRTAEHMTRDALAVREPTADGPRVDPGHLDRACTADFFDGSADRCPFGTTDIPELAGLPDDANVRIEMYETVQDLRDGAVGHHPDTGAELAAGPEPNVDAERILRAVRIVTLADRHYHFVVKLW